jgi:hypothetical protein
MPDAWLDRKSGVFTAECAEVAEKRRGESDGQR